jgi:hypothetical protein
MDDIISGRTLMEGQLMPPWKPWSPNHVGQYVQHNYAFMDQLFDPANGAAFRQAFWNYPNEDALRNAINSHLHLNIPNTVRVGFFDVERPAFHSFPPPINAATDNYYVMILPSMPRRKPGDNTYIEDQAWEDAWYHAVVDGFGM